MTVYIYIYKKDKLYNISCVFFIVSISDEQRMHAMEAEERSIREENAMLQLRLMREMERSSDTLAAAVSERNRRSRWKRSGSSTKWSSRAIPTSGRWTSPVDDQESDGSAHRGWPDSVPRIAARRRSMRFSRRRDRAHSRPARRQTCALRRDSRTDATSNLAAGLRFCFFVFFFH